MQDELYFCASCFQYVAGAELLPEETDEDEEPICPHCKADNWYFSTVDDHGSFTEEQSEALLAVWKKDYDLKQVNEYVRRLPL